MQIGNGEQVLKNYVYCETTAGVRESLTVTNRRVVAIHKDKAGEERSEIRVKDITSVESSYKRKRKLNIWGLLLTIIGIIVFLPLLIEYVDYGYKYGYEEDIISLIFWGGILGLGIFLLVKYSKLCKSFYIVLSTGVRAGKSMTAYASNGPVVIPTAKKGLSGFLSGLFKGNSKKVKILIDERAAMAIVDEVGALIWSLQESDSATLNESEPVKLVEEA